MAFVVNHFLDEDKPDGCLQNIILQDSLEWIFVGGKGGVGKTTVSCGLAIQLAKVREKVLILSTDPAHSISDAFGQLFNKKPTKVDGFDNLFVVEVDPNAHIENETLFGPDDKSDTIWLCNSVMKIILSAFPVTDESTVYAQIMKLVKSMEFTVIVFDTASTGHTLRLLKFPLMLEKALGKILEFKDKITPYLDQIHTFLGFFFNLEDIVPKIEELLGTIKTVNQQFKNHDKTTFICVCNAEFLSLYETERLFQELNKNEIDCHNIVVNQLYTNNEDSDPNCKNCSSRKELQSTYLAQINELYFDFHVTKLPLLEKEVRGVPDLTEFSKHLMIPNYDPSRNLD